MKKRLGILMLGVGMALNGCGQKEEIIPFNPETKTYEAEEGMLLGNCKVQGDAVSGFQQEGDGVTLTIDIEQEGFYDLTFVTDSNGSYKENKVYVDELSVGNAVSNDVKGSQESTLGRVYLTPGTHEVSLMSYWGYINYDKLIVSGSEPLPKDFYEVDTELCNPNATKETKNVYAYLTSIYGEKFLSGQNADSMYSFEFFALKNATMVDGEGKTPAVLGLDLMEYSPSRVSHGGENAQKMVNGEKPGAVESAIDFWEKGGLVTFCWHWNAPEDYLTGQWYSGFYKDSTNINLEKIMNGQDQKGYDLLMADIDAIALQLGRLQDAGVPVLWRPLHEASGGWFWWGASGKDAYLALYKLLYDKLTNEYGLNNLIWVWNGQNAEWYPGDEYCDIVGTDIYPGEKVYTSQMDMFMQTRESCGGKKMVYMTENGCLFDPELAVRDGAMWGMWCTWCDDFVLKANTGILSEQYTEKYMIEKVYASPYVLTLEDLPDFKE